MLSKKGIILISLFFLNLLIALIILLQTFSINPDGILYLKTAFALNHGNIAAAFKLYGWPFYSILIFYFSKLMHLPLTSAAITINIALQSLIVIFFWLIMAEIDKRKIILLIAACIILIYPKLNGYRDYIIRDFGYWAFFLCGIWGMIRYSRQDSFLNIFIFYSGFLFAFLFRIESAAFLVLLPLSCLGFNNTSTTKKIFLIAKLYLPGLCLFITAASYLFIFKHENIMLFGRMSQLSQIILHGWTVLEHGFHYFTQGLINHILTPDAKDSASLIVFWGLTGLWLQKLIFAPGLIFTCLFLYAHYKKTLPLKHNASIILYSAIAIYFLLTAYFVFSTYFLVTRYVIAMCLIILLWTPSALYHLYHHSKRWIFFTVMLIIATLAIGGIVKFGPSKAYIAKSAAWLKSNSKPEAIICSNDKFLLIKVKGINVSFKNILFDTPYSALEPANIKCDYIIAIVNRKKMKVFLQKQNKLQMQPIKTFHNRHGDQAFIYSKQKN